MSIDNQPQIGGFPARTASSSVPSRPAVATLPPPDPRAAVSIRGLYKRFDRKIAVNGLSLDIPVGSFFGLVGPNGAGKTTTLNMVTGLLVPDAGTAMILGQDVWQDVNAAQVLDTYMKKLPREWELPDLAELRKNKGVRAWRLPMGFTAWPPWRPGVLFAGDALGAGKPVSGAGISKALESGLAAGECAVAALQNAGPQDFTNYQQRMNDAWGREYRRGRIMHRALGNP